MPQCARRPTVRTRPTDKLYDVLVLFPPLIAAMTEFCCEELCREATVVLGVGREWENWEDALRPGATRPPPPPPPLPGAL